MNCPYYIVFEQNYENFKGSIDKEDDSMRWLSGDTRGRLIIIPFLSSIAQTNQAIVIDHIIKVERIDDVDTRQGRTQNQTEWK